MLTYSSKYRVDNGRSPVEPGRDCSFISSLPSFLRPLPCTGSLGCLKPLSSFQSSLILDPLPSIADLDVKDGSLIHLIDAGVEQATHIPDVSLVHDGDETPLTRLLLTMQEYNADVLAFKDASYLAAIDPNANNEPEHSQSSTPKHEQIPGTEVVPSIKKAKKHRNLSSKRFIRPQIFALRGVSKAARRAIREGQWRRRRMRQKNYAESQVTPPRGNTSTVLVDGNREPHESDVASPNSRSSSPSKFSLYSQAVFLP